MAFGLTLEELRSLLEEEFAEAAEDLSDPGANEAFLRLADLIARVIYRNNRRIDEQLTDLGIPERPFS